MKQHEISRHEALGPHFSGQVTQLILRFLFPENRREEFIGDLIEEADTVVLPAKGRKAALRWFWWQVAESIPPLLARSLEKEIQMGKLRWGVAIAILVLGTLMASDSGLWAADPMTIALVMFAIAVPAAVGLISGNIVFRGVGVAISAVLLIAIRQFSGVELRWYAMAYIFFFLLIGWNVERRNFSSRYINRNRI